MLAVHQIFWLYIAHILPENKFQFEILTFTSHTGPRISQTDPANVVNSSRQVTLSCLSPENRPFKDSLMLLPVLQVFIMSK